MGLMIIETGDASQERGSRRAILARAALRWSGLREAAFERAWILA
jgi:hypothetical protein